jgi:dGTPase
MTSRTLAQELASDHSRVVYSPAFRRLAQKAQVFSLESNAAVRNRITHSLEVSDVGRLIAQSVSESLINSGFIEPDFMVPIIYASECACLLHDIGNPPFGHFGEEAIKRWFRDNGKSLYEVSLDGSTADHRALQLLADFEQFDGNPQGLRILLRLKRDKDDCSYNLTYTTLLAFLKYVRGPLDSGRGGLKNKAGFFESERLLVEQMKATIGMDNDSRHPLAYIMEAADDIAYCISDIEDGLEKGIIGYTEFFNELHADWEAEAGPGLGFPLGRWPSGTTYSEQHFYGFKISYTQDAIDQACNYFHDQFDEILQGKLVSLFPEKSQEAKAFESLKRFSRRKLFRSRESEDIELAGHQVVLGLLDQFSPLLRCTEVKFNSLIEARDNPKVLKGANLDLEWRLFNRLPGKHMRAYQDQLNSLDRTLFPEWYLRAHLIVDYISGMTDHYALAQFQLLSGIKIIKEQ